MRKVRCSAVFLQYVKDTCLVYPCPSFPPSLSPISNLYTSIHLSIHSNALYVLSGLGICVEVWKCGSVYVCTNRRFYPHHRH